MSVEFNPYHQWLAIPEGVQAPNHYELLGLCVGEGSAELIGSAVEQRSRCLEPFLDGVQGILARRLLNEIAAARSCLLDPHAKADYDRQLQCGKGARGGERSLPPCPAQPQLRPRSGPPPSATPERVSPAVEALAQETVDAFPAGGEHRAASPRSAVARLPGQPVPRPAPRSLAAGSAATPAVLEPLDDELDGPRVPMVGKMELEAILAELAEAMQECRRLYLSSVPPSQGFLKTASRQFALSQERLHRGLLAKVYATVAEADGRWAYEEQRCAAALLRHMGVAVAEEQLEETARRIAGQAAGLQWRQLLQPFREVPELRPRLPDLQTVVARIANLVAKADGRVASQETKVLQAILDEFLFEQPGVADAVPPQLAAAADAVPQGIPAPWEGTPAPRQAKRGKVDREQLRTDSLRRLDALVGLPQIKHELRELADWACFQSERRQAGLPHETPDLRFMFLGPAGTGKSHVARLLSEILFASGVLKHGHLVEADAFDLTSREPHDAARRMKEKIRQAVGGTLLIDCSGALAAAGELPDAVVIRALRENVVAHAGRFAVVLADRSDRLPAQLDRQPRLAQLFHRCWQFGGYHAGELGQMFQTCCDRGHYQVSRQAQIKLLLSLHWQLHQDVERFGYGHGVRRVFERAVRRLAGRIAGLSPLTKEMLTTFHDGDIAIDGVPPQLFGNLADPQRAFRIPCPGCASVTLVGPDFLGIRVECRRCHHRFVCAWGEPVG